MGAITICKHSQIQAMAGLTTTVELEGSLESNALLRSRSLGVGLLSGIEGVHIGLVVLGVVESHDLLRDIGLQGIVGVR